MDEFTTCGPAFLRLKSLV